MLGPRRVHTRGGVGERTSLGAGAGDATCGCGSERYDAAVEECGPGKGPRGGGVAPAAGQGVGLGVEGGEVAGGAGVVLREEPGLVHAEGGAEEGRPVRDPEGGGGSQSWEAGESEAKRASSDQPCRANMAAILAIHSASVEWPARA